ncbi:conjugal transfer protein TraH [Mesorhizobium sp. M3A.F.Ca.ET.080.04.2.1]|uniref:TraH family protein n=1 Tax=Mesorhizobium sp. M3A.F.Ca.ET.080.04.2.1 TaxID=2493676 RepID=UPI000F751E3E|nr:TraH family protein [Mesorhizobium sp. M3A.F.Ca.ET.080.04.2.1]AZO07720.1 conjugal transfer protein TraH [Mesorhizobium sp. M3A.F.Ca.ET.080.04.2.1]RWF13600.1 MAG: conjugal transfer protein TraH [Mesorhizobium sp.]
MVDAALIEQCTDRGLKPAIVEKFIERAGSQDPLAITVRSGNRVVVIPRPATPDEAMDLISQHVGRAVVRVGITQYPAGLGVMEAGELKRDLVDACANLRMGTALFAKVYRIVTKWYGNPAEEAFDDAIIAWQTGYFEGESVFRAADPRDIGAAAPAADKGTLEPANSEATSDKDSAEDPNRAGIRVDLSQIGLRSD